MNSDSEFEDATSQPASSPQAIVKDIQDKDQPSPSNPNPLLIDDPVKNVVNDEQPPTDIHNMTTTNKDHGFEDFDEDFDDFTAAPPSSSLEQESRQSYPSTTSPQPSSTSLIDQQQPNLIPEEIFIIPCDEEEENRLLKSLSSGTLKDIESAELRNQVFKALKIALPIPVTSLSSNKPHPNTTVEGFLYEESNTHNESILPNLQSAPSPSSSPSYVPSPSQQAKSLIIPNPTLFASDAWYNLYKRLASESTYNNDLNSISNNTRFRWRKSNTRRAFLKGLGVLEDSQPNVVGGGSGSSTGKLNLTVQQQGSSIRASTDSESSTSILTNGLRGPSVDGWNGHAAGYLQDLAVAKNLTNISEDTIRRMNAEELRAVKVSIMDSTQRMQDQVNFWLDGREQLVMDAEMHNKMIASLVQYAQQQQLSNAAAAKRRKGKKLQEI